MANYVPGTAITLDTMDVASIRKTAYDGKLRRKTVRPSIFFALGSQHHINDMEDNVISMSKAGILMNVSSIGRAQQGQSIKAAMRLPLRKRPRYGTGEDILGNEDEGTLLQATFKYNEIKKGVKFNQWGYNFNDTSYLNFNAGYTDDMALFMSENDDDRIQQTLLFTCSDELTYTPTSLTRNFNKNWGIPNLVDSSQPEWDVSPLPTETAAAEEVTDLYYPGTYYSGAGSFAENIAAAMLAASGTGATPKATLTVDHLMAIHNYDQMNHIVDSMLIDGVWSKVLKIATPVKHFLLNPATSGSLASYLIKVKEYKDPKYALPGEIGRFLDDWVVVHDTRCPTLTVSGAAQAYRLTPGFLHPGNNDDRNLSAWSATSGSQNYVFDVCTLMGPGAVAVFTRDELVTGLSENTEYGKRKGMAMYKGEGMQQPHFDKDAASADDTTYKGSMVIPVSRIPVDTIT